MAGYSTKPLVQKLGIKEGMTLLLINTPNEYTKLLSPLPKSLTIHHEPSTTYDFIHFFARSQELLTEKFPQLKQSLKPSGMLWISWTKGTCGVGLTDLNENIVRNIGLENGLVDVKVAAIDDEWSGLKFVYRLKDR